MASPSKIGRMSADEFQVIYDKFKGSVSGIAKHYGVARQTVYDKIAKCGIERPLQEPKKQSKKQPAANKSNRQRKRDENVAKTAEIVNNPEKAQLMFTGASESTDKSFLTLDMLAMFLNRVQSNLDRVLKEMNDNPTGKIKPFQVDLMLKLIKEGRSLIGDSHKIRKDLFDIQGTMAFMEAVVRVLEEEIPDVQEKLFLKLSQLGFEEQIAGANFSSNTSYKATESQDAEAANSG